MEVKINLKKQDNNWVLEKAIIGRTARGYYGRDCLCVIKQIKKINFAII